MRWRRPAQDGCWPRWWPSDPLARLEARRRLPDGRDPILEITQTTVPGFGVMHHLVTRSGKELRLLVEHTGRRELYLYGSAPSEAVATIALEADEADAIADLLHSASI